MSGQNQVNPYVSGPALIQIGDITVTQDRVITPRGTAPLAGSTWAINDRSVRVSNTAVWGIVLAIVLFFVIFLFSLLFLLAKETKIEGYFEVIVTSDNLWHTTYIPAASAQGYAAFQQVQYAQFLARQAG